MGCKGSRVRISPSRPSRPDVLSSLTCRPIYTAPGHISVRIIKPSHASESPTLQPLRHFPTGADGVGMSNGLLVTRRPMSYKAPSIQAMERTELQSLALKDGGYVVHVSAEEIQALL